MKVVDRRTFIAALLSLPFFRWCRPKVRELTEWTNIQGPAECLWDPSVLKAPLGLRTVGILQRLNNKTGEITVERIEYQEMYKDA